MEWDSSNITALGASIASVLTAAGAIIIGLRNKDGKEIREDAERMRELLDYERKSGHRHHQIRVLLMDHAMKLDHRVRADRQLAQSMLATHGIVAAIPWQDIPGFPDVESIHPPIPHPDERHP